MLNAFPRWHERDDAPWTGAPDNEEPGEDGLTRAERQRETIAAGKNGGDRDDD